MNTQKEWNTLYAHLGRLAPDVNDYSPRELKMEEPNQSEPRIDGYELRSTQIHN